MKNLIEESFNRLKNIYKKEGLFYSFYTFYRNQTCPMKDIFNLIPSGKIIIDVGAGMGFISIWTALAFKDSIVRGFELNKNRVEFANRLSQDIKNVTFEVKDITKDTIIEGDIILLIDLFHHVPYDAQFDFLSKCINKIPKGGYIVFKDIDRTPKWKFFVNYIQDFLFSRQKIYCRSSNEYIDFFKKNGFVTEYIDLSKGYAYPHYMIKAKKH